MSQNGRTLNSKRLELRKSFPNFSFQSLSNEKIVYGKTYQKFGDVNLLKFDLVLICEHTIGDLYIKTLPKNILFKIKRFCAQSVIEAEFMGLDFLVQKVVKMIQSTVFVCRPVWPDWAIFWTLGNFYRHLAIFIWSHWCRPTYTRACFYKIYVLFIEKDW